MQKMTSSSTAKNSWLYSSNDLWTAGARARRRQSRTSSTDIGGVSSISTISSTISMTSSLAVSIANDAASSFYVLQYVLYSSSYVIFGNGINKSVSLISAINVALIKKWVLETYSPFESRKFFNPLELNQEHWTQHLLICWTQTNLVLQIDYFSLQENKG